MLSAAIAPPTLWRSTPPWLPKTRFPAAPVAAISTPPAKRCALISPPACAFKLPPDKIVPPMVRSPPVANAISAPAPSPETLMASREDSCILPPEVACPAMVKSPSCASAIKWPSAPMVSNVTSFFAAISTCFLEVMCFANTLWLFDFRTTPLWPKAFCSEIFPSAERCNCPALAAISWRMRTPTPCSVATSLIWSAWRAPKAEPSIAYSGLPVISVSAFIWREA